MQEPEIAAYLIEGRGGQGVGDGGGGNYNNQGDDLVKMKWSGQGS